MIGEDSEVPLEIAQLGDAPINKVDDPLVIEYIKEYLQSAGYHVASIHSVEYMPEIGSYFVLYRCSRYRKLLRPYVIKQPIQVVS